MTASATEEILEIVKAALVGAALVDADAVYRGRLSPAPRLPALNLRRTDTGNESSSPRYDRGRVDFALEHLVDADPEDWETKADALHMAAHAALIANAGLALIVSGLHCTGTEIEGELGDRVIGRLTARYELQILIKRSDLTRPHT